MQHEPMQFGAMSASRAKRSAARLAAGRGARKPSDLSSATVLDEAFADYSRVDAGSSSQSPSAAAPADPRVATRELIADISAQLKTLDSQRRQLARLLETVSSDTTV